MPDEESLGGRAPWLDAVLPRLERAEDVAAVAGPLQVPFAAGLAVVYVVPGDGGARLLAAREANAIGLAEPDLRERAVRNLRRAVGPVDRVGGPEAYTLAAGGEHEASLLLDDRLWQPRHVPVEGDLVAAVPRRDLLLVTGTGSPVGVARLRQLAREAHGKGDGALTPELLVRRGAAWEVLPAWSPGGGAPR